MSTGVSHNDEVYTSTILPFVQASLQLCYFHDIIDWIGQVPSIIITDYREFIQKQINTCRYCRFYRIKATDYLIKKLGLVALWSLQILPGKLTSLTSDSINQPIMACGLVKLMYKLRACITRVNLAWLGWVMGNCFIFCCFDILSWFIHPWYMILQLA